jgi:DNA-binding response OmpR family regulator
MSTDTIRPARILIVARPATSRAISTALALGGYEVHRTPDANSAVEVARRLRPNLAIVAADVPGSSGHLVARQLRTSQDDLPIIVLGEVNESSVSQGLEYLPEDIDPSGLLSSIASRIVTRPRAGNLNGS